ncbi:MAG: DUF4097 family beta strand repeat-containing protein [Ktedonobacteraceae bacterium]
MSIQEEGRTSTEERPVEQPQEGETPQTTTPLPPEQPIRQAVQPPQYPPYARQNYYPGPGQQPYYGPYYGPPYAPPRRRRLVWPWIVLAVFLTLTFTWLGGLAFGNVGFNFSGYTNSVAEAPRHFAVSATPTVVINNDIGSIHVQSGGTGSDVAIQATKYAGFGGNVNDVQVNYTQNSAANIVTVNVDRTTNATFFSSLKVDFEVTVPNNAALEIKTTTGGLDVSGVSGQMSLQSNTGSVDVRDGVLSPGSSLNSNTGSITFNGSISKTGSYQFTTNTGSINVTLPANSVFHLDASTDTGSITSDFPGVYVQHTNFTGATAHSDVGSAPQATITMTTNTGSISLHES